MGREVSGANYQEEGCLIEADLEPETKVVRSINKPSDLYRTHFIRASYQNESEPCSVKIKQNMLQ